DMPLPLPPPPPPPPGPPIGGPWPAVGGVAVPPPILPPIDACPTGPRFWVGVDYLYFWLSEATAPPLVTGSSSGTQFSSTGILGQHGPPPLSTGATNQTGPSGFRLYGGAWIRPDSNFGVGFDVFSLFENSSSFSASSSGAPGAPLLARPFINAQTGVEAS